VIGRNRERETLQGLLDAATEGRAGALVVHGEAGIGKSTRQLARLFDEERPPAGVGGA
jgi:predicted ATPase